MQQCLRQSKYQFRNYDYFRATEVMSVTLSCNRFSWITTVNTVNTDRGYTAVNKNSQWKTQWHNPSTETLIGRTPLTWQIEFFTSSVFVLSHRAPVNISGPVSRLSSKRRTNQNPFRKKAGSREWGH